MASFAAAGAAMFDVLITVVMAGIILSLGFGLYFLVNDKSETNRTAWSLTARVVLAVLLLVILALGFMSRG